MASHARRLVLISILSIALVGAGQSANARPGPWLGLGVASQTAGGDLDGTSNAAFADSTGTKAVVAGKLTAGSGLAADFGYGINPYLAAEGLLAVTHHNATAPVVQPKLDSTATLTSILFGFRATAPLRNDGLELFARAMLGLYSVTYADYGLNGTLAGNTFTYTSTDTATFTGSGLAVGIGAEVFAGQNFAISAGYTYSSAKFTLASSQGVSGTIAHSLNAPITTLDILLTYHFGVPKA